MGESMKYLKIIIFLFFISFVGITAQKKEPFPKGGMKAIMENVKYPESAKKANIEGKVLVKAIIDENGNVANASIEKSANDDLDKAALNAIRATKFTPAEKDGKIVKSEVVIPILFKLADKKK